MKNRLCLLFLSLLSLLAASVTYGYITVVSSSFPSTITGGTTYPFRFTTEHADTHWFYMRLQYLGHDNAWYSIANHPESSNNNGWDYALRDERRAWTFYGSLPGNRTWFCRVVAGTVDAFNTSVFRGETTIATFNVTATGSPDINSLDSQYRSGTAFEYRQWCRIGSIQHLLCKWGLLVQYCGQLLCALPRSKRKLLD